MLPCSAAAASPLHVQARSKRWPAIRAGLEGLGVAAEAIGRCRQLLLQVGGAAPGCACWGSCVSAPDAVLSCCSSLCPCRHLPGVISPGLSSSSLVLPPTACPPCETPSSLTRGAAAPAVCRPRASRKPPCCACALCWAAPPPPPHPPPARGATGPPPRPWPASTSWQACCPTLLPGVCRVVPASSSSTLLWSPPRLTSTLVYCSSCSWYSPPPAWPRWWPWVAGGRGGG